MTLSTSSSRETRERVTEKIFHPLLENNVTQKEVDSEEERLELEKREHYHRHVDGGKLPPKTVKEIEKMLDQKYVFPAFNILIYAQNHILKIASSEECVEANRDGLY